MVLTVVYSCVLPGFPNLSKDRLSSVIGWELMNDTTSFPGTK